MIVADDLTGACDAALPFLAPGRRVLVGLEALPETAADVVAVSTETRDAEPATAAARVDAAIRRALDATTAPIFKKVDSRLRGAVGAELAAALRATGAPYAVLAPALPRMGRVVRDGVLAMPDAPAVDVAALAAAAGLQAITVGAATDAEALAAAIAAAAADGAEVVVCDTADDDELAAVAAAGEALGPAPLLAGTSALATAVAVRHVPPPVPHDAAAPRPAAARVLLALGSPQPALGRQLERLVAEREVRSVSLGDAQRLLAGGDGLGSGGLVVETIRDGWRADAGVGVAVALAATAVSVLDAGPFDAVICSGGAVAAALCRALGAGALELVGSLAPAFPIARLALDGTAPLLLALRSGGFGDDDELLRAYDAVLEGTW